MRYWAAIAALAATCVLSITVSAAPQVRVGVLKFGTVNWELDVIRHHQLDAANNIKIKIIPFASSSAAQIALQGGEADIIVSDYFWVSRQRNMGKDWTFAPYSSAVGALMVPPQSALRDLSDLSGKRLGVAGGPLDKGWLLLRALSQKNGGEDLITAIQPQFGAPPLLNKKIEQGELDAVLSFWHWCARLEAKGYRRLLPVEEAARRLGVNKPIVLLGYVFSESWAAAHPEVVTGFLKASQAAKNIMRNNDAEWERLRELTHAKDEATFRTFRIRFREGIPTKFGEIEKIAAQQLYTILATVGGKNLTQGSSKLAEGTFWPGATF